MSEWQPATEVEAAMGEALAAMDQEHYFRILARSELLLPVSAEALAGRAPMGWGTWTTGNRTHVLAFTSAAALYTCLNEPGGSYRTVAFHTLAQDWPNYEWWLAVNPGLPIESYLPSWFVAQLTRGDVRLPGGAPRARARAQSDLAAALGGRVRATAPAGVDVGQPGPRFGQPRPGGAANGHSPVTETVEAEIIDYPPVSGSARVYAPGYPAPGYTATSYPATETAAPAGTGVDGTAPGSPASGQAATDGRFAAAETLVTPRGRFSAAFDGPVSPPPPASASAFVRPVAPSRSPRDAEEAEIVSPPVWDTFAPANETESNLLAAAQQNNTDAFLSTLLLARVILPVPPGTPPTAHPRERAFPWRMEQSGGRRFISVFTSPERLAEHRAFGPSATSVSLRFVQLIGAWPDAEVAFAVNPGSPVGATLPGSQIVALASWAAEVGLRDEPAAEVVVAPKKNESKPAIGVAGAPAVAPDRPTVMQRTVPPNQLPFYIERGYDRVCGFVNRASEVAHLTAPKALYRALGLVYPGSPFHEDDADVHVLRWVAHRTDLYRIPYGGQHEAAMRAMQGWVIERPPFRGNSFAPGDTDVVAEFKVDSVRLPHGAQMWRLRSDGTESLVATFDADTSTWVRTAGGWDA